MFAEASGPALDGIEARLTAAIAVVVALLQQREAAAVRFTPGSDIPTTSGALYP
jgi:hypothetical protein